MKTYNDRVLTPEQYLEVKQKKKNRKKRRKKK